LENTGELNIRGPPPSCPGAQLSLRQLVVSVGQLVDAQFWHVVSGGCPPWQELTHSAAQALQLHIESARNSSNEPGQ
jgi:hypothetical protein